MLKYLKKWYVLAALMILMWALLIWISFQIGWLPYGDKNLWDTIIEPFVNWRDYFDETPFDFGNDTVNIVIAIIFNVNLTFNFFVELFYLGVNIQNAIREWLGRGESTIKRNKWGVVYDSVSKEPIKQALVRLYDQDGQKLVKTAISNVNGVFNFHVQPGSYLIKVQRSGFNYPSKVVAGIEDPPWTKVYHGQVFTVKEETEVEMAIPLDPLEVKPWVRAWNQVWTRASSFIITTNFVWLIGGFIYSIPTAIYYRDSLAGVLPFFAYITFFILRYYQARLLPVNDGIVTDTDGNPVPQLPLAVFETDFGQLVVRIHTDENGRYRFLLNPAAYLLRVMDQKYALLNENGEVIPEIHIPIVKRGRTMVVNKDLKVRDQGAQPDSLIANASKAEQRAEQLRGAMDIPETKPVTPPTKPLLRLNTPKSTVIPATPPLTSTPSTVPLPATPQPPTSIPPTDTPVPPPQATPQ